MESLKGDQIRIISGFSSSPFKMQFSWETSHDFKIGDAVTYVDDYKDKNSTQDYLSWMIIFKADDGLEYSASQLYFKTEEDWEKLKKHFGKHSITH